MECRDRHCRGVRLIQNLHVVMVNHPRGVTLEVNVRVSCLSVLFQIHSFNSAVHLLSIHRHYTAYTPRRQYITTQINEEEQVDVEADLERG